MAATTTYLSLGAFYAADKRRDISREHDLGLWWLGDDWHAPRFRAAWVAQTGELYLMQHEGTPGGGRVDVVATASSLEEIESRLDGWRDVVGDWGSVHWLRERLGLPETGRRGAAALRPRPWRPTSPRPREVERRPFRRRDGAGPTFDALELALVGPGHLDGVLGRRVARDDVVGRLVV